MSGTNIALEGDSRGSRFFRSAFWFSGFHLEASSQLFLALQPAILAKGEPVLSLSKGPPLDPPMLRCRAGCVKWLPQRGSAEQVTLQNKGLFIRKGNA